jgi:2-C-methyl-D-erythritol 4-phosphate cytidylyltransferase
MSTQSQREPQHTGNERVAGIVLAAGLGARFGPAEQTPKQFLDLGGEPVVVRSVRAVLACRAVETLVCAVPPAWRQRAAALFEAARLPRPIALVEGGATRQESARRSLEALAHPPAPDLVLLHDAARPLVSLEAVEAALLAARQHGAAVVAAPSVNTIATTNAGFLDAVLDRSALVSVQTPQAFRYGLIREAHRRAAQEGISDASDDSVLVLRLGRRVAVVPGPHANIKITSPQDLELARLLLSRPTA